MRLLFKKTIHLIVFSNFFIALCAASITYINTLYLGLLEFQWIYSIFIFCATFIAYNFQRLIRIKKTNRSQASIRLYWIHKNKRSLIFFNLLLAIIACLMLFYLPIQFFLLSIPVAILSIWYVLGFKNNKALREIPFIKVFVIAIVWTLACFDIPLFLSDHPWDLEILFFNIAFLAFLVFQTIPFDIRDMLYDKSLNIKTIASHYGLEKSKYITIFVGILSISGFAIISNLLFITDKKVILLSYLISLLIGILMVFNIKKDAKEIYFSLIIESILIFPCIFYLFWRIIRIYF